MEPTKEQIQEGIVNINLENVRSNVKDDYHIDSSVHDVLVLEICRLQPTKDGVSDCLIQQQQALIAANHQENMIGYGLIGGLVFVVAICLVLMMRGQRQ